MRAALFAALMLSAVEAWSAEAPLSWNDCVGIALRQNASLASAQQAVEAARKSYYGSYNTVLPQIGLSNSYANGSGYGAGRAGGTNYWSAQGTASMDLFDMGRYAGIRLAAASLAVSEASLREASASVRLSLREAFSQLLYAQEYINVSGNILDLREKNAKLIELEYNAGKQSKGDLLRVRAEEAQAQADADQAQRGLRLAQRNLDAVLGFDDFSAVAVTGTLAGYRDMSYPDMAPLVERRPDVAAQRAVVDESRASLAQSEGVLLPSLSINYSRSVSGPREFPNQNYGWNAGATLSLPIFGSGITSAYFNISAAQRALRKAREDLRGVREQARVSLEAAWSTWAQAVDQVKVQRALLDADRQRNLEQDVLFASGLISFDIWEITISNRVNDERGVLTTALNATNAEAAFEQARGVSLEE